MDTAEFFDGHSAGLAQRMRDAVGDMSLRDLARATAYHAETVRRYMASGKVSTDFVIRIALATGVRVEWLLTGEGSRTEAKHRTHALSQASVQSLVAVLGDGIAADRSKMEELEARIIALEALLAASGSTAARGARVPSGSPDSRRQST